MSSPVVALRRLLQLNNLHAYFIPAADAHQSEYIAPCDARRGFVSSFTGSAGFAVVTHDEAALWTDGRYFLQAAQQLDSSIWTLQKQGLADTPSMEQYLLDSVLTVTEQGSKRIGFDPTLVTVKQAASLKEFLDNVPGVEVVGVKENLVDDVWGEERPPRPAMPVNVLPVKYSGKTHVDKITDLRKFLHDWKSKDKKKADKTEAAGLVVTGLDEIAWLFNLRGSDITYNPVFFAYSVITADKCSLYTDKSRLSSEVIKHLSEAGVDVHPYGAIMKDLSSLDLKPATVGIARKMLISATCNVAILEAIGGEENVETVPSPIVKAKSIKNETELNGFRQCHLRDAVALCNYFAWLEDEVTVKGNTTISEASAADKLELFRADQNDFMGPSFDTISSVGANAAIIHYKPKPEKCSIIDTKQVYLCDSGGQYRDGTTDVTRTMHFGTPSDFEKELYTRVLKGHISLDKVVFPTNTTGFMLDTLARTHLWQAGLDYRHGTGHGVGHFLNVHEGPHGIGPRVSYNEFALEPGMVVTNEPGYYHDGHCGFRIENILLVKKVKTAHQFADVQYLGFENVTLVPMCRKLMDKKLLTAEDVQWLNAFHEQCWTSISPRLKSDSLGIKWLRKETLPL